MGNFSSWQLKSSKLVRFKYHNMTKKNSMKWLRYFFPSLLFYHQSHLKWLKNILWKTTELRILLGPTGIPSNSELFVECSRPGRLHLFAEQERRDPIRYKLSIDNVTCNKINQKTISRAKYHAVNWSVSACYHMLKSGKFLRNLKA